MVLHIFLLPSWGITHSKMRLNLICFYFSDNCGIFPNQNCIFHLACNFGRLAHLESVVFFVALTTKKMVPQKNVKCGSFFLKTM